MDKMILKEKALMFSTKFIAATKEYTTHDKFIPAPYLRKSFTLEALPKKASLTICGLGFYKLYLNGEEITNGYLASFQSNPDDVLYYDVYDVKPLLKKGENVIGIHLGNGFLNCIGGQVWDFDQAAFRSAPKTALAFETEKGVLFEADENFKTHASPIIFDDMREGEHYDARAEIEGWADIGFDDTAWEYAICAETPKGEPTVSTAPTLQVMQVLSPVRYHAYGNGYIFDFGENTAGFARFTLKNATAGQVLDFTYFERLADDNGPYTYNIRFGSRTRDGFVQQGRYICKDGEQTYQPSFVWFGYRFLFIEGLTEEQAKTLEVEALEIRSSVELRGHFACSDKMANQIVDLVRRSDLTNLFHYPVDCPHREKNGWTADAALSCEQMLLQMNIEDSLTEWLKSIRAAQNEEGTIPGIVPTGGWGFAWGNGPAWDCILFWLPYQIYQYRGDRQVLIDNAVAMQRYLVYMSGKRNEDGLLAYGLGDWCQSDTSHNGWFKTPLEITDSLTGCDICAKAEKIFLTLGDKKWAAYAKNLGKELAAAFRKKWIASNGYCVKNEMQTAQAMAIKLGMFAPSKKKAAVEELVSRIHRDGDHFVVGVVGGYALFNVLAENGFAELAYRLITQTSPPSYGYLVSIGETTLWENLFDFGDSQSNVYLKDGESIQSLNHHFWGFVYTFFTKYVAGLIFNPNANDITYAEVKPIFIAGLTHAETSYEAPLGKIFVKWEKKDRKTFLSVTVPKGMKIKLSVQGKEELLEGGAYRKVYNAI